MHERSAQHRAATLGAAQSASAQLLTKELQAETVVRMAVVDEEYPVWLCGEPRAARPCRMRLCTACRLDSSQEVAQYRYSCFMCWLASELSFLIVFSFRRLARRAPVVCRELASISTSTKTQSTEFGAGIYTYNATGNAKILVARHEPRLVDPQSTHG